MPPKCAAFVKNGNPPPNRPISGLPVIQTKPAKVIGPTVSRKRHSSSKWTRAELQRSSWLVVQSPDCDYLAFIRPPMPRWARHSWRSTCSWVNRRIRHGIEIITVSIEMPGSETDMAQSTSQKSFTRAPIQAFERLQCNPVISREMHRIAIIRRC